MSVGKDPASFGRDLVTFFALEGEAMGRNPERIEAAGEDMAAEWVNLSQIAGVNNDPILAHIVLMESVDQLPGRAAVKVAAECNLKIA